MSQTKT